MNKMGTIRTKVSRSHLETRAFLSLTFRSPKASDSLNEGLPIKMIRENFQRKLCFFYDKDSRFNPRLIHKKLFSHWTSTN